MVVKQEFHHPQCPQRKTDDRRPCSWEAGFPLYQNLDPSIRTCLINTVPAWAYSYWEWFSHYKQGHLLVAGALAEQPILYLRGMEVLSGAVAEAEQSAREERKPRVKGF